MKHLRGCGISPARLLRLLERRSTKRCPGLALVTGRNANRGNGIIQPVAVLRGDSEWALVAFYLCLPHLRAGPRPPLKLDHDGSLLIRYGTQFPSQELPKPLVVSRHEQLSAGT